MRVRSILAAALVAAAAPLAASADICPTNADLDEGVRLTRAEPFFSVVQTRTPDGLAEARVTERDGTPLETESYYDHPITVIRRIGPNGTLELDYENDPQQINQIDETFEWSSGVVLLADGDLVNAGSVTVAYLGTGDATIGDCTYTVWRLQDTMTLNGSPPMMFEKAYAPALGLVVSSIRLNPDGSPMNAVFFDEIAAE